MPLMPSCVSASRTSSSLNGLMMAMTSFIDGPRRTPEIGAQDNETAHRPRPGAPHPHDYRQSGKKLSGFVAATPGETPILWATVAAQAVTRPMRERGRPDWQFD